MSIAARTERTAAERLIEAAGPVLAQRGFDKATVREIAGIAKVNVAAVSYHFGDKMGLYRAVLREIRLKRQQQFPTPVLDLDDPASTLRQIVWTLLSRMLCGRESGWEAQLMMREIHQPTGVLREMIEEYFRPLYVTLCETLEALIGSADSTQPVSASWRTDALVPQIAFGIVGQCHHHMIAQPVIEQLIDETTRREHFDLESVCRHITASTLAVCDGHSVIHHRLKLESSPCDGI